MRTLVDVLIGLGLVALAAVAPAVLPGLWGWGLAALIAGFALWFVGKLFERT